LASTNLFGAEVPLSMRPLPPIRVTVRPPQPIRALDTWRRRLTAEVVQFPRTLGQLREGAENFRRVTQRLLDATAGLEQANAMQANVNEMRQRVDDATRAMREQLGAVPGAERVAGTLDDLNSTLAAMARMNPFWPLGQRRPGR
jgi:hypothetical protein